MKIISRNNEQGSAHAIVITGLSVALIVAVGYIFWTNIIQTKTKDDTAVSATTSQTPSVVASTTPVVADGTIQGSLTYPSEAIPSELEVHATNLTTGKDYVTKVQLKSSAYKYGTGYRVSVPEGRYNVYAVLASKPDQKAYYDQFVICGMMASCKDDTKVDVAVTAGKDTADIMVGDWYNL